MTELLHCACVASVVNSENHRERGKGGKGGKGLVVAVHTAGYHSWRDNRPRINTRASACNRRFAFRESRESYLHANAESSKTAYDDVPREIYLSCKDRSRGIGHDIWILSTVKSVDRRNSAGIIFHQRQVEFKFVNGGFCSFQDKFVSRIISLWHVLLICFNVHFADKICRPNCNKKIRVNRWAFGW